MRFLTRLFENLTTRNVMKPRVSKSLNDCRHHKILLSHYLWKNLNCPIVKPHAQEIHGIHRETPCPCVHFHWSNPKNNIVK